MQATTVNDQLIAYRHRPSGGRTVVFANSLGSDQSLWDAVIERLGGGYGTLTYDLRGHGHSAVSQGFGIADMADDLIALMDRLGLRDVILCGVSVGGMVAQSVAFKRPDLLGGVILSNTAPTIGTDEKWSARIAAVTENGIASIADTILETWFCPAFAAENPDNWQSCRNMLCRTPDTGYAAVCNAIRDADLTADTAGITVPVHCVAGARDGSVTPDQVIAMARLIPDSGLTVFDGVGHLPALEAPARMAHLIEGFDAQIKSGSDLGMAVRRSVLGDAHVDRAQAAKTAFDMPFQSLITAGAWGTVWASEGISRRERSMITLGLLAATGNFEEIPMHIRATTRTGATVRDIQEVFQHVAIYTGVPRANHALKLAKQTLVEMEAEMQRDADD